MATRRAASLRPGQFRHLIRVAAVTGRKPERDVILLLYLSPHHRHPGYRAGLDEVGDVLFPSGAIRPEVYLRAEITKGCRPRNIYLTQPNLSVDQNTIRRAFELARASYSLHKRRPFGACTLLQCGKMPASSWDSVQSRNPNQ